MKIVEQIKEYFKIEELVHPDILFSLGEEKCWSNFPEIVLHYLLRTRLEYGFPLTINTYLWGEGKVDSGVRRFNDDKYAENSTHKQWNTFDLKDYAGHHKRLHQFIEIWADALNMERVESFDHTETWAHCQYGTKVITETYWFNP